VSETGLLRTPSYPDLLRAAYALGRVDGLLAADFEPLRSARPSSACCRGREPADFARHLWDVPDGDPPAGLEANAPHWYARGFEEALAESPSRSTA
jgi:hypothetical protein